MTYLLKADHRTIFVLDEPDVYLHPDLQHRLLRNVLSRVGQLFIATHSSEIINDVDPGDVVMVRPGARSAKRVRTEVDYGHLFNLIGSSENAQFSRLARTKKVIYFEGNDRKLLRKIGARAGFEGIFEDGETNFMKTEGFSNWSRVSTTSWLFREMFGFDVKVAAIFDRDYRSDEEISDFELDMKKSDVFCRVLPCKEIENLILNDRAIIAAVGKIIDREKYPNWCDTVREIIDIATRDSFSDVLSMRIGDMTQYYAQKGKKFDGKTLAARVKEQLTSDWVMPRRLSVVHGKDSFAKICLAIKKELGVSITQSRVADQIGPTDLPDGVIDIFRDLKAYFLN